MWIATPTQSPISIRPDHGTITIQERTSKSQAPQLVGRSRGTGTLRTPFGEDELAALWAATEGEAGKLSRAVRIIIQLAILTALRRTEICGARMSELVGLDTDAPVWVIPGDVNKRGKIIEGRTKNGREQRVPLGRTSRLRRLASRMLTAAPLGRLSKSTYRSTDLY
jgi:integrase